MTFKQVSRGPTIKQKAQRVADHQIALKWWAHPTAPFIGIAIGGSIAHSIGIIRCTERVDFLFGQGDDAGKVGIRRSDDGCWLCRVRGNEYCVFLDSNTSGKYFALFPRIEIAQRNILIERHAVYFTMPEFARRNSCIDRFAQLERSAAL